jgi:hypothetical protein
MLRLSLLAVVLLAGCCTDPKIIYRTQMIAPEDNLLVDCIVSTPPDINNYELGTMSDREKQLADYTSALLKDASVCNKQFVALRDWKTKATVVVQSQK